METSPVTVQPGASLADRIHAGDKLAEKELVERYSRGVRVILRNAGADRFAADDLHQETFRIALEKIRQGDLRDPATLGGFIAGLARNLATDHFRRKARQPSEDPETLESVHSTERSALERLLDQEEAQCVRELLDELTTRRDREILRRFYLSSEEKDNICKDLELSSLQFNRVLFRARERYRELYQRARRRRDS
jgi:RNA polymerase sigma-70 factor (ECF subfamily)